MILKFIRKHFTQGTEIDKNNIFAAVVVGSSAHISLYFLHAYLFELKESLILRSIATFLCLTVGFYSKLTGKIRDQIFPFYWHIMLITALPMSICYMTLINNFNEIWLWWMIFMPIALSIFVPSWFIFVIDLLIGLCAAALIYSVNHDELIFREGFDLFSFALVFCFSTGSGIIFVFGNRNAWLAKQNLQHRKLTSIAGSIAHELRNPINAIKVSADNLNNTNENAKFKENLKKILDLANDIIDMTLQQLSGKELNKKDFANLSAQQSVLDALKIYSYASNAEKERVLVNFGGEKAYSVKEIEDENYDIDKFSFGKDFNFFGLDTAFKYIIFNLLKNSLHYLSQYPKSKVTIGTEQRQIDDKLYNVIYVFDKGPGIKSEYANNIFGDFFTIGKKGGTGLGLAFCKRSMLQFGGDIIWESVADPNYREGGVNSGVENMSLDVSIEHKVESWTKFSLLFPISAESESSENKEELIKKILIVDDEKTNLLITKSKIEKNLNFKCDTALNGEEAYKIIKENPESYSVILMDIQMPEMNGIEAAKRIKALNLNIPIIALTSLPSETINEISKSYFDNYLNKPVAGHILHRSITKLIDGYCDNFQYLGSEDQYLKELVGKKIILADDQELNLRITSKKLRSLGLEVIEVTNGQDIIEQYQKSIFETKSENSGEDLVKKSSFHMVITDINMPGISGLEATQTIRKIERENGILHINKVPVIALSGDGARENIEEFFRNEITDYFIKGDEPSRLIKIIATYLTPHKIFIKKEEKKLSSESEENSATKVAESTKTEIQVSEEKSLETATETQSEAKIINDAKLRFFDNKEKINFLEIFIKETSEHLNEIEKLIKTKDLEKISNCLHALKGTSGNVGAEIFFAEVKKVEAEVKKIIKEKCENGVCKTDITLADKISEIEKFSWVKDLKEEFAVLKKEIESEYFSQKSNLSDNK